MNQSGSQWLSLLKESTRLMKDCFSYPCRIKNRKLSIVQGLEQHSVIGRNAFNATLAELRNERDKVRHLL